MSTNTSTWKSIFIIFCFNFGRYPHHNHSMAWNGQTNEQDCDVSPSVLGCGGWSNEKIRTHQNGQCPVSLFEMGKKQEI